MTSKKEVIGTLIPLLGIYFSACGLIYYMFFYDQFGIRILSFLDNSEIFLGLFQALYLEFFWSNNTLQFTITLLIFVMSLIRLPNKTRFIDIVSIYFTNYLVIIAFVTAILSFLLFRSVRKLLPFQEFTHLLLLLCCLVPMYNVLKIFAGDSFEIKKLMKYLIAFFYFFLFFVLYSAYEGAQTVKSKGYKYVSFVYKGKAISSTKTNYFIGGVKNYLFFYTYLNDSLDTKHGYKAYKREDAENFKIEYDEEAVSNKIPNNNQPSELQTK
jgi:hypothetical protein